VSDLAVTGSGPRRSDPVRRSKHAPPAAKRRRRPRFVPEVWPPLCPARCRLSARDTVSRCAKRSSACSGFSSVARSPRALEWHADPRGEPGRQPPRLLREELRGALKIYETLEVLGNELGRAAEIGFELGGASQQETIRRYERFFELLQARTHDALQQLTELDVKSWDEYLRDVAGVTTDEEWTLIGEAVGMVRRTQTQVTTLQGRPDRLSDFQGLKHDFGLIAAEGRGPLDRAQRALRRLSGARGEFAYCTKEDVDNEASVDTVS
jgi:hypothetical protein